MRIQFEKKPFKTTVFLVEDHPLIRRSLRLLLAMERDLAVCGEADNGLAALQEIAALVPEVVILDIMLKSSNGLELMRKIQSQCPTARMIVFTMCDDTYHVEQALRAGAKGYLTKAEATEEVMEAIRTVMAGRPYLSQSVCSEAMLQLVDGRAARTHRADPHLTERETEIVALLGEGLSTTEIASKLQLSVKTVASHREHIKDRLNMDGAPELMNYAFAKAGQARPVL